MTILAVVAHPDDELSCGGTLARYARQGVPGYVACATRGDGPDAQIKDPAAATRETLGAVRSQEIAASCAVLGVQPPIFLGYQDGAVDAVPVDEAAHALLVLLRQLRPSVLITHDPLGGYGHPDHIAVSAFVTRAFELARANGDAPARFYYFATPRSLRDRVPALRDRAADIRGGKLGFVGVPDEAITTEIPIADLLTLKWQALACHRTQFEFDEHGLPKTFATSVPEPDRSGLFGVERFVRVDARPPQRETDLWA